MSLIFSMLIFTAIICTNAPIQTSINLLKLSYKMLTQDWILLPHGPQELICDSESVLAPRSFKDRYISRIIPENQVFGL